jgi:uncharacterized protein (TIGR03084 family)
VIFDDLRDEMASLDALVSWSEPSNPVLAQTLARDTPAKGWTIGDTLSHLAWTDQAAIVAIKDPGHFPDRVRATRPLSPGDLPAVWPGAREELLSGVARAHAAKARLPWFSLPMGAMSFATARLMEYWAHGEDVACARGISRPPTGRLRHVCHIGVQTLRFSFAQHGLPAPAEPVRIELDAPGGGVWDWGPEDARNRVTGPAAHFALVVTQRRLAADSSLDARGDIAERWLPIAQCFAGNGQITDPDRAGLPMSLGREDQDVGDRNAKGPAFAFRSGFRVPVRVPGSGLRR